jgi:hypothetical protein
MINKEEQTNTLICERIIVGNCYRVNFKVNLKFLMLFSSIFESFTGATSKPTGREQLAETMTFIDYKRLVSSLCHCVHMIIYLQEVRWIEVHLQSSVFPCRPNCLWYKPRASGSDET